MLYGFPEHTLTIFVKEAPIFYCIVTTESIICTIFCVKNLFCLSLISFQFYHQNGTLKGYWPRSLQDVSTLILEI